MTQPIPAYAVYTYQTVLQGALECHVYTSDTNNPTLDQATAEAIAKEVSVEGVTSMVLPVETYSGTVS